MSELSQEIGRTDDALGDGVNCERDYSTSRIANAIFLSLCRDYQDIELRTYYEQGMEFIETETGEKEK